MSDPIELFKQAIAAAGLTPPDVVIDDGKRHRYDTAKKGRKHGWYTFYADGVAAGNFGDWTITDSAGH
jgi:putative DNA primase/helicase